MSHRLSWTAQAILADIDRCQRNHTRTLMPEVADRVGCCRRTVIRRIYELRANGMVAVTPDPSDRRRYTITVLAPGRKVLRQWL